jgi:ABC-type transporter Mla MlaB component
MDLRIYNQNNFYEVKGALNKKNIHVFQDAFKNIFERTTNVRISLEGLEAIDREGKNALAQLHNESLAKQKSLSIIGSGREDIFNFLSQDEQPSRLQRIFLMLKKSVGL